MRRLTTLLRITGLCVLAVAGHADKRTNRSTGDGHIHSPSSLTNISPINNNTKPIASARQASTPSALIYNGDYGSTFGGEVAASAPNSQALLYEIFKQQSATDAVMSGGVVGPGGAVHYQPAHETMEMPTAMDHQQHYQQPSYAHTAAPSPHYPRAALHPETTVEEPETEPPAAKMLFSAESAHYRPAKSTATYASVFESYLSHNPRRQQCSASKDRLAFGDVEKALDAASRKAAWYADTINADGMSTKRRSPFIPNGAVASKVFEFASEALSKRKCYSKTDVVTLLPNVDMSRMWSGAGKAMAACEPKARCDAHAKYRRADGSCNNMHSPEWASSFSCHRRLLPPDYADGVGAPRIAHDGGPLPNARDLSTLLLPDISVQDHRLTSMSMAFGQFAIHDITRTLPFAGDIKCCDLTIPLSKRHPECFPIPIKRHDDPLVQQYNQTCLNFVRTTVCNRCGLGPREQQNQATATFDLSHVYGSRDNDTAKVRERQGGRLKSSFTASVPREELPPKTEVPGCNVRPEPPRFKCFESPDGIRASQHPGLQALHVAFHRRHNAHANALAHVNPHWKDEKLFQEARRISIAEMTSIVYNEYLPAIFGRKLIEHFRLGLSPPGTFSKYDERLNPSTIQEFITAAGRFGHSNINEQFRVLSSGHNKQSPFSFLLGDNFFETTMVSLGHTGGILKGMSLDSTESTDPYFVDEIRNRLYHIRTEKFGRDLPANNIQRGRDHAIAGYAHYLNFCFGFKVKSWADLVTFIPKKQVSKLRAFYRHWRDIDLFVGGISERLIGGAAFGPTFACINGIQFYNFKYGDRFFFEHGQQAGSFKLAQLDNIREVSSLASLICKTNPEIERLPGNVFIQPDPHHNKVQSCYDYPDLNYELWADKGHMDRDYSSHHSSRPSPMKSYTPKPVTKYEVLYDGHYNHPHSSSPKKHRKLPKEGVAKYQVYYHDLASKSPNAVKK